MYSIAVILTYFLNGKGHWPGYIDWFFASCKANSTVDFFVFTDDETMQRHNEAKNIHVVNMSFQECSELVSKKLDGAILTKPYKLCDYKPAYAVIFEEWVKDYDYYGFCDCDLMFGDIRGFFPDSILEKYDKLMILGQFQLSKNTEEVKHYYKLDWPKGSKHENTRTWKKVVTTENYCGWDEGLGLPQVVRENGKPIYRTLKNFSNIYQRIKGGKHMYDKLIDKNDAANRPFQMWQWKNGGIYHINTLTKKETPKLYIHFTERELKFEPYVDQKEIYITENSELKSKVTFKDSVCVWDCCRVLTKKVFVWIHWKLTHLKGKQPWEM